MNSSFAQLIYFAPRGKKRLIKLGNQISQVYLEPEDRLVGLMGDGGAGKSLLITGMFPGLILTNDDDGINARPLPLLADAKEGSLNSHTYHVDARMETAFTQPFELARAVKYAVTEGKRVVIEHFELIADHLELRADMLIGIGEEVLVTRPGVFGPHPKEIANIVFQSIKYRLMAHTAEDLTTYVLDSLGVDRPPPYDYSDIKSGFVLQFDRELDIDIHSIEEKVKEYIEADIEVRAFDSHHIKFGNIIFPCSGPRIHTKSTGKITGFKLKPLEYDPKRGLYLLAGIVGEETSQFRLSQL